MSDYKGAALMLPVLPKAKVLLADKGYDADWFRAALAERGVAACIPSKSNRKVAIPYDVGLYKQRHKIENMFGRFKDWRRIHTRYDRCAHTYLSAIRLERHGENSIATIRKRLTVALAKCLARCPCCHSTPQPPATRFRL